ncbi:hypothetical protein [Streptomyces sp. DSM 41534]
MATPTVAPQPHPIPDDLVTYRLASALLMDSPYPVSPKEVEKWVRRYRIKVWSSGVGRAHRVSLSDVMEAQRDEAIRLDIAT